MHPLEVYLKATKTRYTALAKLLGVTPAAIWNISHGKRQPGAQLSRRLSKATGIPLEKLRPDIWGAR